MGIYTTFTCDKCKRTVDHRRDLRQLRLQLEKPTISYSYEKSHTDVAEAYLCTTCTDELCKAHGLIDIVYDKAPDTSERLFNAVRDIFDELFQEKNNV